MTISKIKNQISNRKIGNPSLSEAGFSLIEMLVVVAVFSILAIVATQSLSSSLRGSKKSESQVIVRENVDFALSTMERLLRNAKSITSCSPTSTLIYIDEYEKPGVTSFQCITSGTDTYIASVSGSPAVSVRLTSPDVRITNCSIFVVCQNLTKPHSVDISIQAERSGVTGAEGSQIIESTKILLRNYGN
ncbi:MAG: General secretion pathway protein H [Candidatus Woesebacteria bacterium GW2011_GWB1_39_12]|uniref:General secretion pathway protein H n=2 Tax=Candidatus Woeseibacteriota TaxID=1752722 RepID=A0A0G0MEI4_9BACT|nr:MAG: General secretion pathway protein H [Candidatus Woesebacteria bacterium GW2011_GWA1_39_12]KKR01866.1 MAG: General secretion pathway protein H [Candidatus Woesebacteria bacterium GW2011_GWB1_39_12]